MSSQAPAPPTPQQPPAKPKERPADKIFAGAAAGSGVLILTVLAGVAAFLLWQGWPAITAHPSEIHEEGLNLGQILGPLVVGTLVSAVLALIIAFPLSVGIAIFITHYAPRKLAQAIGYVVDLLAAVPSIVYGLWGVAVVAKGSVPVSEWLNKWLYVKPTEWGLIGIPLFAGDPSQSGRTMMTVGVVLAIMILPIMTAVNREVFLQTPRLQEEAAMALGATRWETIKMSVIPFGKSGVISGAMLGLGRALGETMAIAIILSVSAGYQSSIITSSGGNTIASNIALSFAESTEIEMSVLVVSGLVLFFITLVVNMLARYIVSNSRKA